MVGGLLATVAALPPLRAEIIEQVLVKVNGEIITQSEFEKRQLTPFGAARAREAHPDSPQFAQAIAEPPRWLILAAVDDFLAAASQGPRPGDDGRKIRG